MSDRVINVNEGVEKALENADLLHNLLQVAVQEKDLQSLLQESLDKLLSVSWLSIQPRGGIFLVDGSGSSLEMVAKTNLHPQIQKMCAVVPFGRCLCGRAALQRKTQHANCVDHRHEITFSEMTPHGHYNVPIKANNRVLGVLVVYLSEGHQSDQEEVEFLERFCDVLAILIQLKRREIDLKATETRLETALQDSKNLMDVVQEHTIFSQTASDGTILDVNDAFCAISGYSREELVGRKHNVVNSGHHSPAFWKSFWGTIRSGVPWRGEICNRSKNGRYYWVDSIVAPLFGTDGSIEKFISVRFDITERKKAEDLVARFGRILDNSSNEIYVFDSETLNIRQANRGAQKNLGYSMDELQKFTAVDLAPELSVDQFKALLVPLVDAQRDFVQFETLLRRKNGSTYPVEVNLHLDRTETPADYVAIVQDITERYAAAARITQLAFYDTLTGLPNRALLMDRFEQALHRAERAGSKLSVLFIDLNRFKEINDTRGHAIGDEILINVAQRLQNSLRKSETLARLGGDEFVIIAEAADEAVSQTIVRRLEEELAEPITLADETFSIGSSVGIAVYPTDGTTAETLLQNADIAMYRAKSAQKEFCFFAPSMSEELQRRTDIAKRLSAAITENKLQLFYQPFVELGTGKICGAESLLRWTDDKWGNLSPSEFIPLAEERRMASTLGYWVLNRACEQLRYWSDNRIEFPGQLAINLSAQQLNESDLISRFEEILKTHHVQPKKIILELTESAMMADPDHAAQVVKSLKAKGFGLAIDDFGTDYSSLSYIKKFDVDKLKIDMSFTRTMLENRNDFAIVKATLAMARGLGIRALAEGIETAYQARSLLALGCEEGQGYWFAHPKNWKDFTNETLLGQQTENALVN